MEFDVSNDDVKCPWCGDLLFDAPEDLHETTYLDATIQIECAVCGMPVDLGAAVR